MSLKENKYIRYFGGHDKKVVTLAMNPADDTFLSGSLDKTIRLWDLRSNHCQVAIQLSSAQYSEPLFVSAGFDEVVRAPSGSLRPRWTDLRCWHQLRIREAL